MTPTLEAEPLGTADTGRCTCCGRLSRKIWGLVRRDGVAHACYFVHWTVGHVFDGGAQIDIVLGKWGEGTRPADRFTIRLDYRILETGPGLMVCDSDSARVEGALAEHCLKRSDVIGGPLVATIFAICDAFLMQDKRLGALWDAPEGC
jgi:hypothetical protein